MSTFSAWCSVKENTSDRALLLSSRGTTAVKNSESVGTRADRALQNLKTNHRETEESLNQSSQFHQGGQYSYTRKPILISLQHRTDKAVHVYGNSVQEQQSAPYRPYQHIADGGPYNYLFLWSALCRVHLQHTAEISHLQDRLFQLSVFINANCRRRTFLNSNCTTIFLQSSEPLIRDVNGGGKLIPF